MRIEANNFDIFCEHSPLVRCLVFASLNESSVPKLSKLTALANMMRDGVFWTTLDFRGTKNYSNTLAAAYVIPVDLYYYFLDTSFLTINEQVRVESTIRSTHAHVCICFIS
jgi:hypothetical protein